MKTLINNLKTNVLKTMTMGAITLMALQGCAQVGQHSTLKTVAMKTSHQEVKTADVDLNDPVIKQLRITGRIQDTKVKAAMQMMSYSQALSMFQETSQMIDARHLSPTTYANRTAAGLKELAAALENQTFRTQAGVQVQGSALQAVTQKLNDVANQIQVRNMNESQQILQYAVNYLQQTTGMNPVWTVYEFTNAIVESQDKYSALNVGANFTNQSVENNIDGLKVADGSDPVVGIGVELKAEATGARVMRPLQNGPAEKAGIARGDLILSANGQNLAGLNLEEMATIIRGPIGSMLLLKVQRGDSAAQMMSLRRNTIEQKSVSEIRMISSAEKVGYIRIDKFAADTTQLVEQGMWNLYNQGMTSLVIDVRGNPGGLLTTAVELSDMFLPQGTIVSTRGRDARDNSQEVAHVEKTWKIPLTVLVDENSASASEIFAAAIQENKRGLVIGTKSYGKGTVQTHFTMQTTNGNLKLTTAKFYSPIGREMAGQGVTPDIFVSTTDQVNWNQDIVLNKALEASSQLVSKNLMAQLNLVINGRS